MVENARRIARWWQLLLPAGIWIWGGKRTLSIARQVMRSGIAPRHAVLYLTRLAGRQSRIGFNVWRERRGKWR